MKLDKSKRILIIGLGLLGGSYAMSLKRQGYQVSAITRRQSSIDYALARGWIDRGAAGIDEEMIASADVAIFALYPQAFIEWVEKYGGLFSPGTVVTDVTGVKQCIVYRVQSLLPESVEFISAHPMAGREVCGIENADDGIFAGANYIVVPTEKNTESAIELCASLGETLGFARVSRLSPEDHDTMIAFLSQLTHCIAVSLMCATDAPGLENYTGDSFRDLTRIANINDEMWSELFLDNQETLLAEMDKYRAAFDQLYERIKNGDREGIRAMMRVSAARRRKFDKRS